MADLFFPSPTIFSSKPFLRLPRPDRLLVNVRFQQSQAPTWNSDLEAVLAQWGLHQESVVSPAGGPGRSDNWLVPTSTCLRLLKRYKKSLDSDWIVHEHSILNGLAEKDFPAPRLIPTEGGRTMVEHGSRIFALFEVYEGYFQYHNSLFFPGMTQQFISAAGKTLATLHQTLPGFVPEGRNPNGFMSMTSGRWREPDWYFERLERCKATLNAVFNLTSDPAIGKQLEVLAWLGERLLVLDKTLKSAELEQVIIHGDYGPYNLLFRQGKPVVVLDFELARLDWRLTDLSAALFYFAHSRYGFHWQKMRWFLDAYRSVVPVGTQEMYFLPLVWQFLSVRRAIVLWEQSLNGNKESEREVRERLDLLAWLVEHEDSLRRL